VLVLDDQQSHSGHDATAAEAVTILSAWGREDAGRRPAADSDAMTRLASRRLRWLLPAGIAAAIAVASVATTVAANASAEPNLAPKTAAQLLVAVENASPPGLSGTIVETAKLGLPDISGLVGNSGGSGVSIESLVTGSNTMNVWYAGQDRQRFALLGQLSEQDVIHNGTDLWSYDSSTRTVTHKTLPKDQSGQVGRSLASSAPSLDPQAAAERALAAIDPTTVVVVDRTARVAGRAAYQLLLTPKDSRSLIGSVQIAIDAATSVPLRVQIFAKGAKSPAFEVGFTSVHFNIPNSSVFEFVPPAGAQVEQDTTPFGDTLTNPFGDGGGLVVHTRVNGKYVGPKGQVPKSQITAPPPVPTKVNGERSVTALGKGWTEVLKISNATPALPAQVSAPPNVPASSNGPQVTVRRVSPLDDIATAVPGGRLITTTLLSIFIADNGTVYVGPVSAADIQKVASTGHGL
jgi:outer membrane lipoprotein-sorting protein